MKSIKLKLVIIYLSLVFIVMIISGTFMLTRTRLQETSKANAELKNFAQMVYDNVIKDREPEDFRDVLVELYGREPSIQCGILTSKGYLYTANVDIELRNKNSAIIAAISGQTDNYGTGRDLDYTGTYIEWANYANPVLTTKGQEPQTYIIFTRKSLEPMLENLNEMGITIVITVALSLVLTGIMGILFANTITGPIIMLTKGSKEMAQGNLDQQIEVHSADEIGQLTMSFNHMGEELNKLMSTMASEKNKVEVILNNMTDGVLAYDSDGNLTHANSASGELLSTVDITKLSFEEMMDKLGNGTMDFQTAVSGGLKDTTITSGDRFLSVSFTPYLDNNEEIIGIVIVLQDITKHKKLDDMRKEFVANVSHEIRTPLTTIKSYTETLLDGAIDEKELSEEFLKTIDSETDRMTLLVKDLLELSRFDNRQLKLERTEIDLIPILEKSIKQNEIIAEKKNQRIVFSEKFRDFRTIGDPDRVNQVFTNIISNALKYSTEGTDVEIYAEETDKYYRIFIKDHGVGIPREDQNRIFERFYRVDKARSRAMGGTGLGLAIAKEIMDLMDGKIFASSTLGKGTTMTLRFNKAPKNKDTET